MVRYIVPHLKSEVSKFGEFLVKVSIFVRINVIAFFFLLFQTRSIGSPMLLKVLLVLSTLLLLTVLVVCLVWSLTADYDTKSGEKNGTFGG